MNTHLDHCGAESRTNAVRAIVRRVQAFQDKGLAVILVGDFNCTPESAPHGFMLRAGFKDAALEVSGSEQYTFHGFHRPVEPPTASRIDWILFSGPIRCLHASTLSDVVASDHFPLVAKFAWVQPLVV